MDNAFSHPPVNELNAVNDNVEVVFLPDNVTALIQPMDQWEISITKKYYKKFLLRGLLFSEAVESADTSLKNFDLKDSFEFLKKSWNTSQNSTLQKIWK